jgi:hypothetical protein
LFGSISNYKTLKLGASTRSDADYFRASSSQLQQIVSLSKRLGVEQCLHLSLDADTLTSYLQNHGISSVQVELLPMLQKLASGATSAGCSIPQDLALQINRLTTCINILQTIDREHLASILEALHLFTERYLIIGVRTFPSTDENLYGATVLSKFTWQKIIEQCGFQFIEILDGGLDENLQSSDNRLSRHWKNSGVGDLDQAASESLMLFEKTSQPKGDFRQNLSELLDIDYREVKRDQLTYTDPRQVFFNFNVPQEWSFFRPLLDVIPRNKVHFLIRYNPFTDELFAAAVRGFLKRNGLQFTIFESIEELPWTDISGNVMITASESTMDQFHMIGHEVTANARLQKCATMLLQHGIWPAFSENRIVSFASEKFLCWSQDEVNRLRGGTHEIYGQQAPWGIIEEEQLCLIGSPKYTDQILPAANTFEMRFGFDRQKYSNKILFGTKNLRGRFGVQNINSDFLSAAGKLFNSFPETLFILRPHPLTRQEEFAEVKTGNVVIMDELTAILADTQLNRVIPHVDALVTSPSTLILDGAVSNKPVFVYSTGQPNIYRGIKEQSLDQIPDALGSAKSLDELRIMGQEFKSNYGEALDDQFYSHFGKLLEQPVDTAVSASTAVSISFSQEVARHKKLAKTKDSELVELRARLSKTRAQSALQKEFIRDLRKQCKHLKQIQKLEDENTVPEATSTTSGDNAGLIGRLFGKNSKGNTVAGVGDKASSAVFSVDEQLNDFDESWYLSRYQDVQSSGMAARAHYSQIGRAESRSANREQEPSFKTFDPDFYCALYPDIANSGADPFLHYVLHGEDEGRLPFNLNKAFTIE